MIESICYSFSLCAERASKGVESAGPTPATGKRCSVLLCVLQCAVVKIVPELNVSNNAIYDCLHR